MKYEVIKVKYGEEQKYLDEGWEPFGVASEDTSYYFQNASNNKREIQYQSLDFLYLKKAFRRGQ